MRKLSILLVMLLAAGCSGYSLQELRYAEPKGSEFNQALARRYLDFSEELAKRYNWVDSARFADKGLLAAYDDEVGPEEVAAYNIPADMAPKFEKARAEMLALLSEKNRKNRPAVAADALFYFDCWLHKQEKGKYPDEIAYCKKHFQDRIDELNDIAFEKTLRAIGEWGPEIDTTSYVVFFDLGQSVINEAGGMVVDEVVKTLSSQDHYEVVLNSHTDTTGNSLYNLQLSQARADAVKARLIAGGVTEEAIKTFAFGESDLKVKTKDGVKEKTNRRVEIFLNE